MTTKRKMKRNSAAQKAVNRFLQAQQQAKDYQTEANRYLAGLQARAATFMQILEEDFPTEARRLKEQLQASNPAPAPVPTSPESEISTPEPDPESAE